jgi:hypothetical protein
MLHQLLDDYVTLGKMASYLSGMLNGASWCFADEDDEQTPSDS